MFNHHYGQALQQQAPVSNNPFHQLHTPSNNPFHQRPLPTYQTLQRPQQSQRPQQQQQWTDSYGGGPNFGYGQQQEHSSLPSFPPRTHGQQQSAPPPSPRVSGRRTSIASQSGLSTYPTAPPAIQPRPFSQPSMQQYGIPAANVDTSTMTSDPMKSLAGHLGQVGVPSGPGYASPVHTGQSFHIPPPLVTQSVHAYESVPVFRRTTACHAISHSTSSPSTAALSATPWAASSASRTLPCESATTPARTVSPALKPARRGSPSFHHIRNTPVRYQPSMRETGSPGQLWMCPKEAVIPYHTNWYVLHTSNEAIPCCPPCYNAFAAGGPLAFTREKQPQTCCQFHTMLPVPHQAGSRPARCW